MTEEIESGEIEHPEIEMEGQSTEQVEEEQSEVAPEAKEDPQERHVKGLTAALAEERSKAREERQRADRMEQMFQKLMDQQAAMRPKEEEKLPDPTEDLGGFLFANQKKLEGELSKFRETMTREEQDRQRFLQEQAALNDYKAKASAFAKEEPNFFAAYNALQQDRVEELQIMGYPADQAVQLAYNEEMMIVSQARQLGQNPAKAIFEVAKRRGLVKTPQKPDQAAETVLSAASKASSMSSARGDAPGGKMTLEKLATLEGAEFDKAWNKMFGH